jgi:hypothetical protein
LDEDEIKIAKENREERRREKEERQKELNEIARCRKLPLPDIVIEGALI